MIESVNVFFSFDQGEKVFFLFDLFSFWEKKLPNNKKKTRGIFQSLKTTGNSKGFEPS